jgi:hypothetical protein
VDQSTTEKICNSDTPTADERKDIKDKLQERLRVLEQSSPDKKPVVNEEEDPEIKSFIQSYYHDSDVEEFEDIIEVSNTEIRDDSGLMVVPKAEPDDQKPCCSKTLKNTSEKKEETGE